MQKLIKTLSFINGVGFGLLAGLTLIFGQYGWTIACLTGIVMSEYTLRKSNG